MIKKIIPSIIIFSLIFAMGFVDAPKAHASINLVQSTTVDVNSTTATCSLSSTGAGDLLLVMYRINFQGISGISFSDTQGDSFTKVTASSDAYVGVAYAYNTTAGNTAITMSGFASNIITMSCLEYSGVLKTADPYDGGNVNLTSSSTSYSSGSITTTGSSDLILGELKPDTSSITPDSPFSQIISDSFGAHGWITYIVQGISQPAGSYNNTGTLSASSNSDTNIVAFKAVTTAIDSDSMTGSTFIIKDPVMNTMGDYGTSTNFQLIDSSDTIFTDVASSTNFIGHFGFLYYPQVTLGTLTATPVATQVNLNWPASTAVGGWTVSGYNVGWSSTSGGPYTYTSVGSATSYSYTGLAPGTYYYVVQTLDAFGNVIGTSNEASATVSQVITFKLSTYDTSSTSAETYAPYSVGLGILSTAQASNSDESSINSIWFDLTTNASSGAVVSVSSANGALKSISKPSDTIPSATATMTPGVANYGICDKDNLVNGSGTFNMVSPFNGATCTTGHVNTVGVVTTSPQIIYNTGNAALYSGRAEIMVNAENSTATPAHNDYSDTLNFIATSTF
ncbi:MAG: hypothetical protein P4L63_01135 [Candidatus Pacebacteria bacterium]|nr:hypothetical protein [Candidatus Paceibacterota bacterium]